MNRERCRELLPIIQAFAEGKEIQYRDTCGVWNLPDSDGVNGRGISFELHPSNYRIKPEPEVIYVNKSNTGTQFIFYNQAAARLSVKDCDGFEYVAKKFVEEL